MRTFDHAVLAALMMLGCDKAPPAGEKNPASSVSPTSAASSAPSAIASSEPQSKKAAAPMIVVDDLACVIDGTRYEFAQPDPRGRIAAGLAGKPGIDGAVVDVTVMRDAKASKAGHVLAALRRAKATEAIVRSQKRDGKMGEVKVAIQYTRQECAAVAFIGKDNSTNVWPVGGGTANRFAKGMAGPDMTLAADGVKKLAAKCDTGVWFIGVDDSHTWAKVFDLALAGREANVQPMQVAFLGEAPVPGRKVIEPPP